MEPAATFETEQEARDYCAKRNAEGGSGSWISWQLESGEWGVAHTNLPKNLMPTGSMTAEKPKPPEPDDPRQQPQVPGYNV